MFNKKRWGSWSYHMCVWHSTRKSLHSTWIEMCFVLPRYSQSCTLWFFDMSLYLELSACSLSRTQTGSKIWKWNLHVQSAMVWISSWLLIFRFSTSLCDLPSQTSRIKSIFSDCSWQVAYGFLGFVCTSAGLSAGFFSTGSSSISGLAISRLDIPPEVGAVHSNTQPT